MKKVLFIPLIILSGILIYGFIHPSAAKQPTSTPENPQGEGIQWLTISQAEQLAKKDGKKVFVDVYTDWCGWCKVMDKKTFSDPAVVAYVKQNYHAVKFNAEQKEPITIQGKKFEFVEQGSRGYHALASAMLQGQLSYPSVVFLDNDMTGLFKAAGFRDAPSFLGLLKYFHEEAYNRNVPIQQYIDKETAGK